MYIRKRIQRRSLSTKTSNNSSWLLVFVFIFSLPFSLLAQETSQQKLKDQLLLIEKQHSITFSYADDVIKDILILAPHPDLSLQEKITYFRKNTGLIFRYLDNNFISISKKRSSGHITVCGYIIDSESNFPLQNATITSSLSHTTSDAFGYFEIRVAQQVKSISIRHLGYTSHSIAMYLFDQQAGCLNINLRPQIETLNEIVLSNYITRGIDKVADGTIHINYQNFGILPGLIETDVLQTIQALPGIQSVEEKVSDINIRGGTHDQNLILWDDIKMYQSGHFFGLISIFNPQITTDAILTKNGTNANYSDGVSGTISMKTNTEINQEFKGSTASNFINADVFFDLPLGQKSSIQLGARKAINDLVKETPTYQKYFDRILQDSEVENVTNSAIKFDFYDTSLRWIYQISKNDFIRVNGILVNNDLNFNESAIIKKDTISRESSLKQQSYAAGISYHRSWNKRFSTTLNLYETDYKLDATNANIEQDQRLIQENKVSETSIKLDSWLKLNDQFKLLNGYHFVETGITNFTDVDNPLYNLLIREVLREHALFSQLHYVTASEKAQIKAGIRYHYIDKFKKHIIEPRIGINYNILKGLNIELLAEMKHQNTSQIINFQNDFLGVEKRRWQLANNRDIPIISSEQISLGLNYSQNNWLISIEPYYKNIKGITSLSQGFLNAYASQRTTGSYAVKGIDMLINKRLNKLSTWMSYSYARNDYTFTEFDEVNFPNNLDIRHTVSTGASLIANDFKLSAGLNWHTGRPTTRPEPDKEIQGGEINYQAANSSRVSNYVRIDASAIYQFNISDNIKAHAGLSVWNGLNHQNVINNYFRLKDKNEVEEVSNKALEFTPNMTFRVFF